MALKAGPSCLWPCSSCCGVLCRGLPFSDVTPRVGDLLPATSSLLSTWKLELLELEFPLLSNCTLCSQVTAQTSSISFHFNKEFLPILPPEMLPKSQVSYPLRIQQMGCYSMKEVITALTVFMFP